MIRPVTMFVTGGESLLQLGESPNNVVSKLVSLTVAWAKAGIGIIQIREPWMSDRGLFELVSIVVDSLAVFDTKVVVNDRLDIAVAAKADGVHLKDEEISTSRIRKQFPRGWLIGRSVHDLATAREVCCGDQLDYLLAGTVKATPSTVAKKIIGFEGLREIAMATDVPVLAIGGLDFIDSENVRKAEGAGLAGVRLFMTGDEFTDEERARLIANCHHFFVGVDGDRAVTR